MHSHTHTHTHTQGSKHGDEDEDADGAFDCAEQQSKALYQLSRAAVLAEKAKAFVVLQNACRLMWNVLQDAKSTPVDVALDCVAAAFPAHALSTPVEAEDGKQSGLPVLNLPPPTSKVVQTGIVTGKSSTSSLLRASWALVRFLGALKQAQASTDGANEHVLRQFQLNQLRLYDDAAPQTTRQLSQLWFRFVPNLDMEFIARFVEFTIQALLHAEQYAELVKLSMDWNKVTDDSYAIATLRFLVYAQRCICEERDVTADRLHAEIENLEEVFQEEVAGVLERKDQRRSMRGRREEDAKLAELQDQHDMQCAPLAAEYKRARSELSRQQERYVYKMYVCERECVCAGM
jgi:hypothetical protein